MGLNTQEALEYHWALDSLAAETLAGRIEAGNQATHLENIYGPLDPDALRKRDENRDRIGKIFTRNSREKFITQGPCSMDRDVDYGKLYNYREELQERHPNALFALRFNSAKPRTGPDWPGLYYDLNPDSRKQLIEVYREALNRGIPILTEITQVSQLGFLAPYLSGVWLGARDMQSTALRTACSAYHLPTGVKNSLSGQPKTVEDAIATIRSNSEDRGNSGVELTIAGSIATDLLPVGEGNKQVAIFARGHELRELITAEERRAAAFEHLGNMCLLGVKLGAAVIIDGSHDVPKMFDLALNDDGKKDPDRLVPVLKEIHAGIKAGRIKQASQIAGLIGEVGPVVGDTDPNFLLDDEHKEQLSKIVHEFLALSI